MKIREKITLQSEAVTLLDKLTGVKAMKRIPVLSRLSAIVVLLLAAVVAYVAPLFKRADTVKEFHENARQFSSASETARGVKLETLNKSGQVLTEVNDRFSMPRVAFFGSGTKAPYSTKLSKNTRACYVQARSNIFGVVDQIVIHSKLEEPSKRESNHLKERNSLLFPIAGHRKNISKTKDSRIIEAAEQLTEWTWTVDNSVQGVIQHESGHRYQLHEYSVDRGHELEGLINKAFKSGWASIVSRYAMTNPSEFFAETFVCYMINQHWRVNPEILEYLKRKDKAAK